MCHFPVSPSKGCGKVLRRTLFKRPSNNRAKAKECEGLSCPLLAVMVCVSVPCKWPSPPTVQMCVAHVIVFMNGVFSA